MSDACLSDEQLRRILDNGGPSSEPAVVEQHIAVCHQCRQRLEGVAGSLPPQALGGDSAPQSDRLADVIARLHKVHPPAQPTQPRVDTFADGLMAPQPHRSAASQADCLGQFGKYEVGRLLGRGGMGAVYVARDTTLDRDVAIKIPSASLIATQESHDRFLREARAIASVRHDNIVTLYAVEEVSDTPFLVMELIDGPSLAERLQALTRLSWEEAVAMGLQVAAALQAAHAQQLVHRDIKPANILIENATNRVRVTDFGLAKSAEDVSLTAAGTLAGTPEYMAPEQIREVAAGPQSDLFSLGTVLYHACSGQSPFTSDTTLGTLSRVATETPPPLHEIDTTIPYWFSELVQRLMSKDPTDRPATAADVIELLSTRRPPPQKLGSPWHQAGSRRAHGRLTRRLLLLAASLVGVVAFVVLAQHARRPSPAIAGPQFRVDGVEQPFATLGSALAAAGDDAQILIFGDGPFHVPGFNAGKTKVTIKAAPGYHPLFLPQWEAPLAPQPFLHAEADVRLEGVEIQWAVTRDEPAADQEPSTCHILAVAGAGVQLTACRLIAGRATGCMRCQEGSLDLADSHLVAADQSCVEWFPHDGLHLRATHCVFEGEDAALRIDGMADHLQAPPADVTLSRNSFATRQALKFVLQTPMRRFRLLVERNVFDTHSALTVMRGSNFAFHRSSLNMRRRMLTNRFEWTESANAFRSGIRYLSTEMRGGDMGMSALGGSADDWNALWNQVDTESFETALELPAAVSPESASGGPDPLAGIRRLPVSAPGDIGAKLDRVGPRRDGRKSLPAL